MPVTIFFCYAHKDEPLLNELKTHLIPLRLEGLIDFWYDRDISAGMKWEQQIKEQLNAAQIVLLLISPDFMASDYINNVELKRALERDEQGEARVIPVILRHASWKIPTLRNLQALPTDAKPIKSWSDFDEAFVNVTDGIRKVVMQLTSPHASASPVIAETMPQAATTKRVSQTTSNLKDYAQQAASKGKETGSTLGDLAQRATSDVKQTGQDIADTTKQKAQSIKQSSSQAAAKPSLITPTIQQPKNEAPVLLPLPVEQLMLLLTLTGHKSLVHSVAISPDGQTLVSGSEDKTIKVWKLSTGKLVRTLTGHANTVRSVAISPNGQTLVSGSSDNTIRVWRV